MKMSFRQIAHAQSLSRHRNFRLAATELHISQPALTRSIRALEGVMGTRLFDRLPTGVELTPAGEVFLARGRRVLQEGEDLQRALTDLLGLAAGSLAVSTGPFPGDALVPDALAALMRLAPDIRCRVREADWTDIPGHLLDREVDLAVADISGVEGDDRFETELLITDHLYFICRSGHPLARKRRVDLADFSQYPLVGNRVPGRVAQFLADPAAESGNQQEGIPFRVKIDVATLAACRRVLLATDGITMAPLAQVAPELRDGSITVLQTGTVTPRMHSGLIYLKGRSLSTAASQFVRELRRIKADMDGQTADLAAALGVG